MLISVTVINKSSNFNFEAINSTSIIKSTLNMSNQVLGHETSSGALGNGRTAVNIGDNDATIVVPAGYNPNDIIIVKN